jgi:RimJ/RimL family protein N-acetyltransferase
MIQGDTIRLRALERSDVPSFTRWLNDPDVRRNLKVEGPKSEAAELEWYEKMRAAQERILGIEVRDGDGWRLIGNIGLVGVDWRERVASIGIVIGERDDWGKGYGRDAIRALARYAFEELNLHRLELEVYAFNERARRCYAACGFRHEGTRRAAVFRGGEYHDAHVMGMLAGELAPPAGEEAGR